MIEFKTLNDSDPKIIFDCFVHAFQKYYIPLDSNFEVHYERWIQSGVDFSFSIGAFHKNNLVGFLLLIPLQKVIFNLATGVVPEFRGMGLAKGMYEFADSLFESSFKEMILEVIIQNRRAIGVYEKLGFRKERELSCFQGKVPRLLTDPFPHLQYHVKELRFDDEMREMVKFPYSTENSEEILLMNPKDFELHELREDNKLLAFSILQPATSRILQIEGNQERELLTSLLFKMKLSGEYVRINNIDVGNHFLTKYFMDKGLANDIDQYEMKKITVRP